MAGSETVSEEGSRKLQSEQGAGEARPRAGDREAQTQRPGHRETEEPAGAETASLDTP